MVVLVMSRVPDEIGKLLVKLARSAIESTLKEGRLDTSIDDVQVPPIRRGVFVTIYSYPSMELRGCVGYPLPQEDFKESLIKAALMAAYNDPRFPPLRRDELDKVVIEVSLLTEPELIRVADRTELTRVIRLGIDGLIIESKYGSGLLLPQVPIEYGWDVEEYLVNLCLKAGLPPTYWLDKEPKIYRFTAEIFMELSPGGEVVRHELGGDPCDASI